MQYHIIAICIIIIELIVLPIIPFIIYKKLFYNKIKQTKQELASFLSLLFMVISIIPLSIAAVVIINMHIESVLL